MTYRLDCLLREWGVDWINVAVHATAAECFEDWRSNHLDQSARITGVGIAKTLYLVAWCDERS
jgi:hypothetical protein